ncbi:amidohydrolase [Streptomyces shenzhenensis]|uniref:Amidohydrolase n=1 Tax=Streptomyces shenzhenensis TaxID=943815 RepID=A0A3M0I617_9ACTN|nr:amidohydrolase [Streptomyces shenzhenensis]RMB85021.1 amidohydrolase [Streptomyces shenzhenensis]
MTSLDGLSPTTDPSDSADSGLTLTGVRLGSRGPVCALRIADGRIVTVSAADDLGGPALDLDGRTVLPGLWDAHVHLAQWAGNRRRVDLSGLESARAVAEALRPYAGDLSSGEVLTGQGFRDGLWPDMPDKALLDAVCPDRPVALISADLHAAWLNSAGLALVGRGDHPTGVLREHECFEVLRALPEVPADVLDRWVAQACRDASARGVTGIIDFHFADNLADWSRRAAHAPLDVRVRAAVYPRHLAAVASRGLRTGDVLPGTGGLVRVGPLKLFTDGSLNTRTALCCDPYPGLAGSAEAYGIEETSYEELVRLMRWAAAHGIEPAVHAIGDRANTVALDAFAAVRCRGRIEHAQLLTATDVPRFAELGVTVGVQPAHATDDRDVADRHWAGRTGRAYAYADLLAAGAALEFGSDAPVSPLDPWTGIAAAVHRTDDGRPAWHPEQRVPVQAALAASALGRSLIRVGDPADLVVVDVDPTDADAHTLRAMPVHATLLGGRWTHGPA